MYNHLRRPRNRLYISEMEALSAPAAGLPLALGPSAAAANPLLAELQGSLAARGAAMAAAATLTPPMPMTPLASMVPLAAPGPTAPLASLVTPPGPSLGAELQQAAARAAQRNGAQLAAGVEAARAARAAEIAAQPLHPEALEKAQQIGSMVEQRRSNILQSIAQL